MRGRDRRPRWKRAVFRGRPGMTAGCQVLLLRLLEDMSADGYVSVPRTRLAADLGVAPARISERIKLARSLGFLDIAEQPRPTRTAVYQATVPDDGRGTEPVPLEVRKPVSITGTESVPPSEGDSRSAEVRMYPTHRYATAQRNVGHGADSPPRANEEEADGWGLADARR